MDLFLNTDAATMSPMALFMQADWVVKAVMLGLLLASIWTWAIIVSLLGRIGKVRKAADKFETDYRRTADIDAFYRGHGDEDHPIARVFAAGVTEWRRSTGGRTVDREGTRERLATTMGAAVALEIDRLSDRLNMLATVGSVAPFVGLFGTVWGIMRSFTAIASEQNTSLAVVAPGIAEALFATAIGLFAAIPAVIAYNRFSHGINKVEARLNRFADGFHATLSRQLDDGPVAPAQQQRGTLL
ncbi:protein TolQ [Sphingomonas turrisvirgatae]|uniref:Protein TolQ n=1 Tax=Sphingomonas turrisvirgatae TaxID=1888892 RepID=A0A1E3LT77_9SPHN|nr:protein TolQ [Sphingomonas turrisvirgatae]ODP36939.1 protein TolQ [Sphingomonas turrisvirgatae]